MSYAETTNVLQPIIHNNNTIIIELGQELDNGDFIGKAVIGNEISRYGWTIYLCNVLNHTSINGKVKMCLNDGKRVIR